MCDIDGLHFLVGYLEARSQKGHGGVGGGLGGGGGGGGGLGGGGGGGLGGGGGVTLPGKLRLHAREEANLRITQTCALEQAPCARVSARARASLHRFKLNS